MPNTWEKGLRSYRYPVALEDFQYAHRFPRWFSFDLGNGGRSSTIEFESHFRKHAQKNIAVWLEVVFWKLYSQPSHRDRLTCNVATHFQVSGISAKSLWQTCMTYISKPVRATFESFRQLFGFQSQAVAVVATFPAFLDPESYPMVDTRIAKLVGNCMGAHNEAYRTGPQLIRPPFLDSKRTVLTVAYYEFMRHWTLWCVYTAHKLTKQTSFNRRARDVEMAVFNAWGGRGNRHPVFHLNPLPRA